jgi:hypothetical protein
MAWTKLDQILDQVEDPEAGLELLSKRPEGETPEQAVNLLFWQIQFMQRRDWQQGDVLAVSRALIICSLGKKPPPNWLCKAIHELCARHMSPHDKRANRRLLEHFRRWEAAALVRYERRVCGDDIWAAAAAKLAGTSAECNEDTVRKSHQLIKRAGGNQVTLPSYKHVANEGYRRRKKPTRKI